MVTLMYFGSYIFHVQKLTHNNSNQFEGKK